MAVDEKQDGDVITASDWNSISEEFTTMDVINNEFAVRIAQNEFENNLNDLNYDGGFFIIWNDKEKIGVTTSVDGFEDGDFSNNAVWTETDTGGSAQIQTNVVKNGSEALEITTSSGGDHTLRTDAAEFESNSTTDLWVRTTSQTFTQIFYTKTTDELSTGTQIRMNDSGNWQLQIENETTTNLSNFGSYSVDKWYRVEVNHDFENSEATANIYDINDTLLHSTTVQYPSGYDFGETDFLQLERNDKVDGSSYFDDVLYKKTALKTNVGVTTGTGGNVKLIKERVIFDDFEDNDIQGWTGETGSFTASTTDAISGTYSGVLSADGGNKEVELPLNDVKPSEFEFTVKLDKKTSATSNFDSVRIEIKDSGNFLLLLRFLDGDDTIDLFAGRDIRIQNGWSANEAYRLVLSNIDYVEETFDYEVTRLSDGTVLGSGSTEFVGSCQHIGNIKFSNDAQSNRDAIIDDIKGKGGFFSSGSVTSVKFDLSNDLAQAPNTVVLSDTRQLPDDSTIEYVLEDANGNTKTLTQADVDTEVDISNFTSPKISVKTKLFANTSQTKTPVSEDVSAHFKV